MAFNINDYEMVKDRLPLFFDYFPDGRITTEILSESGTHVTIKASLFVDKEEQLNNCALATGIAREVAGGHIDKYTENCETSAIGRALANRNVYGELGKETGNRPSREEMMSAGSQENPQAVEDAFVQSQAPVGNYDAGEIASAEAFGEAPQMQAPKCKNDGATLDKKKGPSGEFWGCPNYKPNREGCNYTENIISI
tara:strand:+ start:2621 stop:3211 length:591 start_codon:yes stop_codon:yes gene_type:complete